MPLRKRRLSWAGRDFRPRSDGRSPAITSHSSSVRSPRAMTTPAKSSHESEISLFGNPLCQRILALSIAKGSPFVGLDQAAVDTVRRAQPLPPVPETFPDPIELTIPVEFYLR
ncbi:MAG: energy transducer TonB [Sphingobium sp.]